MNMVKMEASRILALCKCIGVLTGLAAILWLSMGSNRLSAHPDPQKGQNLTASKTQDEDDHEKGKAAPEFLRVYKEGKRPISLQTAVVKYQKPGVIDGPEVTLIGAVHIAEASYYSELNQMFRTFDALLFEMVMDPESGIPDPKERGVSPVSTIQVGMKDALELTFQLDEVDYKAKNFVHADMTPKEFFEMMENREEGLFQLVLRSIGSSLAMQSSGKNTGDIDLLAAIVAEDRAKSMRRAFAEQMQMMDGQMAAITGEDGKSTLITERNAKAFEVLDSELQAGKKKLGIFYGAGHLQDMHERLTEDFGMVPTDTKWLNAWDLK